MLGGSMKGNYFASRDYVVWDVRRGVLRSRGGARLIAFPEQWSTGLLAGLEDECGEAWPVVVHRCGEWWGRRHMERLSKELGAFYGVALEDTATVQVHACIVQSFATHGWGRLVLDVSDLEHGLLWADVSEAPMSAAMLAAKRDAKGRTLDGLLAGILGGMFAEATKADVTAHEVSCVGRGDARCRFVIGDRSRIAEAPAMARKRLPVEEIAQALCAARRAA
jgi:predicted hydrocarbon binding protein